MKYILLFHNENEIRMIICVAIYFPLNQFLLLKFKVFYVFFPAYLNFSKVKEDFKQCFIMFFLNFLNSDVDII